jgi:pyridoxine 5-phosphate synthase
VHDVKPAQVTLVPDPPGVLTSNAGWNAIGEMAFLKEVISDLISAGIRVSIFMETNKEQISAAVDTGTDRIELYTGPYAEQYPHDPNSAIAPYREAALYAHELGLGVNAGHDLNLDNLAFFKSEIPVLQEVSIGHALICDALYFGLENTIQHYLRKLK